MNLHLNHMRYRIKSWTVWILCLLAGPVWGQEPVRIGLKGGLNFTMPVIPETYQVLQPGVYDAIPGGEKEYSPMFGEGTMGGQIGLMGLIPVGSGFYIQPECVYYGYQYRYTSHYSWQDAISGDALDLTQRHQQSLSYIEIPVQLRFDFFPEPFSPFVHAGGYFGFRVQSGKTMETRFLPASQLPADPEAGFVPGAEGSMNNLTLGWNAGLMAGAGLRYRFQRFELGLDLNYRLGLVNIADPSMRYSAGNIWMLNAMDVMDDTFLHSLEMSLYILLPVGGKSGNYGFGTTFCSFTRKKR